MEVSRLRARLVHSERSLTVVIFLFFYFFFLLSVNRFIQSYIEKRPGCEESVFRSTGKEAAVIFREQRCAGMYWVCQVHFYQIPVKP